jgi:DeoR/GlpR family transcriptional regulator of sugar metabolism
LTTPEVTVAASDRALAAAGSRRYVLVDHTKIGKETMWQTIGIEDIDVLITDSKSDKAELDALRREGVDVVTADLADRPDQTG